MVPKAGFNGCILIAAVISIEIQDFHKSKSLRRLQLQHVGFLVNGVFFNSDSQGRTGKAIFSDEESNPTIANSLFFQNGSDK